MLEQRRHMVIHNVTSDPSALTRLEILSTREDRWRDADTGCRLHKENGLVTQPASSPSTRYDYLTKYSARGESQADIFTNMWASLPLVTGKAAPEHRCHSVSSLFQPAKEKRRRKQKRSEQQTTRSGQLKEGFTVENFDYLFVHFNVQPVGHFIVLQNKEGEKGKHYNTLIFSVHFIHLHTHTTKNASIYSTQYLATPARENHINHFESAFAFIYIFILCIEKCRCSCHVICNWSLAIWEALKAYMCCRSCGKSLIMYDWTNKWRRSGHSWRALEFRRLHCDI